MTLSSESSPFAYFNYSDEAFGNWSEMLKRFAFEGYRGISSFVLWGAHERLRGARDFSRTSGLRLEKFLKLVGETGLELELKIGFPPARESIPVWALGNSFLTTVLPSGVWSATPEPLGLLRVPSLFDVDFLEAFFEFVEETMSIVALYLRPEGPVSRIQIDLGIYEHDLGVVETASYVDQLQLRYPTIDPFNTNYRTTFKDFVAATSAQGTRAILDKRPWLAAYDYKWCRAKMLAEVVEKIIRLPTLNPLRPFIEFQALSRAHTGNTMPWEIAIDPVLLEAATSGHCYPFTPSGLVHSYAINSFRLWEYLEEWANVNGTSIHFLPPAPIQKAFRSSLLLVIAGKYLSRSSYRAIDEWVIAGGQAAFPVDFPQYDEFMGALDWGTPADRIQVRGESGSFTKIHRGKGGYWIPSAFVRVTQSLWAELSELGGSLINSEIA